jgi:hypothetical protein
MARRGYAFASGRTQGTALGPYSELERSCDRSLDDTREYFPDWRV